MLAFTVVFEEVALHKTTIFFQDFPEELLVQVNLTHLFLGLQVLKKILLKLCLASAVSNRGLPAPSPHVADGAEQEAVLCCFLSFKEIIPEEEGGLCYGEISSPVEPDLSSFFSSQFTRCHPDGWRKGNGRSRVRSPRCCQGAGLPSIRPRMGEQTLCLAHALAALQRSAGDYPLI